MRVKKGCDPAARVLVGGLVVADAGPAKELQEKVLVIIHEGVAGVGVLLYVVGDEGAFQSALQRIGVALLPLRLAAVAADDGAGRLEEVVHIGRQLSTVVDAGRREAVAGEQQQRKSPAHAKADDAPIGRTSGRE